MYAIIESGGKQYWVTPGETVRVEKLLAEPGQELVLAALWAAQPSPDGDSESKAPDSKSAKVVAEVLRHGRAAKVLVFKKRPKKGYKKMQGHRQWYTEIKIKEVRLN